MGCTVGKSISLKIHRTVYVGERTDDEADGPWRQRWFRSQEVHKASIQYPWFVPITKHEAALSLIRFSVRTLTGGRAECIISQVSTLVIRLPLHLPHYFCLQPQLPPFLLPGTSTNSNSAISFWSFPPPCLPIPPPCRCSTARLLSLWFRLSLLICWFSIFFSSSFPFFFLSVFFFHLYNQVFHLQESVLKQISLLLLLTVCFPQSHQEQNIFFCMEKLQLKKTLTLVFWLLSWAPPTTAGVS